MSERGTVEEVRDQVARVLGWTRCERHHGADKELVGWAPPPNHRPIAFCCAGHPITKTIDGIAALWPKGWAWTRGYVIGAKGLHWIGFGNAHDHDDRAVIPDTGDEYADRLRLLLAVLATGSGERT